MTVETTPHKTCEVCFRTGPDVAMFVTASRELRMSVEAPSCPDKHCVEGRLRAGAGYLMGLAREADDLSVSKKLDHLVAVMDARRLYERDWGTSASRAAFLRTEESVLQFLEIADRWTEE